MNTRGQGTTWLPMRTLAGAFGVCLILGAAPQAAEEQDARSYKGVTVQRESLPAAACSTCVDFGASTQAGKNRMIRQATQLLANGQPEAARDLMILVLREDPTNSKARALLDKALHQAVLRERVMTQVEHSVEFDQRMLEVDKASIPYVEPKKVQTTVKSSPYSQEIKMDEEPQHIGAMREELQGVLVDLDFRNADLREVIRYLAEVSDINIVIDEGALLASNDAAMPEPISLTGSPAAPQPAAPMPSPRNGPAAEIADPVSSAASTPNSPSAASPPAGDGSHLVNADGAMPTYQAPKPPAIRSPKVTIFLKQIPLLTALDIILRTKGLKYRIEKDFIWISTETNLALEEMVTRIYTIQHAIGDFEDFQAQGLDLSQLTFGTGSMGSDLSSRFFNESSGSSSGSRSSGSRSSRSGSSSASRTEAEVAEGLIDTLKQVVPQPPGAQMTLYQRTGKLIVRNTPTNLQILEGLLRNLDVSSMQVAIEVRLVEIRAQTGMDMGVYFNVLEKSSDYATDDKGNVISGTGGGGKLDLPQQGFGRLLSASQEGVTMTFDTIDRFTVNAAIRAMEADNKATVLSAPKLTCLNNQTANIQIASTTNYIAASDTITNVTNGVSNTDVSQTIGQIPEGIVLEITPNVSADQKTIRLTVHPKVTELVELESIKDNHGRITTQLPKVTQRSLDTTVSIRNGGTLVLGGLMRNTDSSRQRGVPGVSRVPVIGNLFKNRNEVNDRTNLVIFISASILNSEGDVVQIQIEGPGGQTISKESDTAEVKP